jgi:pimeloyl-ACP methyl ester carboxylesterase
MAQISINGLNLYYELHGSGPPLMLIAGLASDSQSWLPVIEDLSSQYKLILPDNRGTGRTKPMEVVSSISLMADDLAALIKHLELKNVHVMGHSMGGFIAIDLAARYPELLDKLILAGTASSNSMRNNILFENWAINIRKGMDPETWFRELFCWIFTERFFEDQDALDEAVRIAIDYPFPQSPQAFNNQVKALASYNGSQYLEKISNSTLVITGREDLLYPMETARILAANIPGANLAIIDGAAHALFTEQPKTFTDHVLAYLSG